MVSVRVEAGGWALQKAVGKKKCLFYTVAVMLDQPGLLEPAHTRATFYLSVAEARRVEVHQNFRKTRKKGKKTVLKTKGTQKPNVIYNTYLDPGLRIRKVNRLKGILRVTGEM